MRVITIEIPSGPFERFSRDIVLPARLPVQIGDDERVSARVADYEVTPHAIRVQLELSDADTAVLVDDVRAYSLVAA